jgi:hypothetical protein
LERIGFGEVAQFLEDRGVQDLLEPCESATSNCSVEGAMIECESNNDVAVYIGWPVAQQTRLRRQCRRNFYVQSILVITVRTDGRVALPGQPDCRYDRDYALGGKNRCKNILIETPGKTAAEGCEK